MQRKPFPQAGASETNTRQRFILCLRKWVRLQSCSSRPSLWPQNWDICTHKLNSMIVCAWQLASVTKIIHGFARVTHNFEEAVADQEAEVVTAPPASTPLTAREAAAYRTSPVFFLKRHPFTGRGTYKSMLYSLQYVFWNITHASTSVIGSCVELLRRTPLSLFVSGALSSNLKAGWTVWC